MEEMNFSQFFVKRFQKVEMSSVWICRLYGPLAKIPAVILPHLHSQNWYHIWKWKFHSELAAMGFPFSNKNKMFTLLFIFPNFYIINLPTIIAIQFLDGVGENIVNPI